MSSKQQTKTIDRTNSSGVREHAVRQVMFLFTVGLMLVVLGAAAAAQNTGAATGTPGCAVAPIDEPARPAPSTISSDMDTASTTLLAQFTPALIDHLLANHPEVKVNFPGLFDGSSKLSEGLVKTGSFIIHIVLWSPPANGAQTVQEQSWYVYTKGKLSMNHRLYGAHPFYFIYLHLNVRSQYQSKYDFAITKTTPLPIQHLNTLLSFATGPAASSNTGAGLTDSGFRWGGRQIETDCTTADIVITPGVTGTKASAAGSSPNSESPAASAGSNDAFSTPVTFHNEAASWWDVSVAFPVTSINQVTFDSSANGLVPSKIDKKSLYGVFNFYWYSKQRMQIAKDGFSWYPSIIAGIPLASQPLHKPLFGVAWGSPLAQIYIGGIVAKQPTAPAGAGQSVCTGWCPQFSFGIDFGVKALASKTTSSK